VTQFQMKDVEALGLLKMDFLGLRNLDVIDKAVELIGGDLDIDTIALDDKKTYEMLARGEATGVFQFESTGMREALRQVKPTEFEDLIALVALYRPGPMQYIPTYAARKNGTEPVTFLDPRLKPILGLTMAISVYQEQSMEISKEIAGFTLFEAEDLRRAIGKKDHKLMASLKDKFIDGCINNDTSDSVARQLWDDLEKAQDYSFNKAHAACYALISYRTAWLRAHHPCEYMAALISSVMNTKDRVPFYVNACVELGIEVLPPDVNESHVDFAVVGGKIRFGLNAVKGVGELACRTIIQARGEGGPFESIWDFTERVDVSMVNKRALESLIKCGALPGSRMGMLQVLEQALAYGQKQQADRLAGQASIFDGLLGEEEASSSARHHPPVPPQEFEKPDLLRLEKETLGLYVSEHPLSPLRAELRAKTDATIAELERRRDGENVVVGGIVSDVKQITSKRGEQMVFMRLDDVTGGVECVVFAAAYAAASSLCVPDRIVIVKGRVDHKEGETKLLASEITGFESAEARRTVRLRIDATTARAGIIGDLATLLRDYPGESPVLVDCVTSQGPLVLRLGPRFCVQPDGDFYAEVRALLGESALAS
jgi:DNA polymerase-3 subunit alpha